MQPEDYTVGWICAVETECVAALQLLDEKHKQLELQLKNDDNAYNFGRIGGHNVVVACLPKGKYGIASAAKVATHMLRSFESIRIGLMVGIGGGAPTLKNDVRLGDVVVGAPTGNVGGVVPYDFGKAIQNKKFELTSSLNAPPAALLAALTTLHATHEIEGHRIAEHVSVITKNSRLERFKRPPPEQDRLYSTEYAHVKDGASCESGCSMSTPCLLQREPRQNGEDQPVVHYGLIASADKLMKDARIRDKLAEELHVLCFEMEAAGLMDSFPCVVIRGICDYSDSHKNDMWQGYAAAAAAAYAKELLCSIPGSRVVEQQRASDAVQKPVTPGFNVPFDRVSQIFGRKDIMTGIEKTLEAKGTVLLAGIGGVGKSALAIEYCYRYKFKNPNSNVFWGYASTHARFVQAYRDIAVHLRLPGLQDPKTDPLMLTFDWLCNEDNGEWLLVLDNWDDMSFFISHAKYLPSKNPKGSVIITTRDSRLGISTEKAVIQVPRLDEESAKQLLQSKLPDVEERQTEGGHQPDMTTLLAKLDYLPLAITQAIAYVKINGTTIAKYIDLISSDSDFIDTLSTEHPDVRRYSDLPNSVIQTWKVSFDYIRVHSPRATELLYLMAMLDSQSIPRWLLKKSWAEKELIPALGTLKAFSLITQKKGDEAFVMQHLVQTATQHYLHQQCEKDKYQEKAVELLYQTFPNGKHENWETCKSLYTHAEAVLQYESSSNPLYLPVLRHKLAEYDWQQGRYDLAYQRSLEAYDELVKLLGRNHPEAIDSLQLVASILRKKGKYQEAEQKQSEVVKLRGDVAPKNKADMLTSMNELAMIFWDRGKYRAAEQLHREVLKERQGFLDENHPDVLTSMDNLAQVLRDLGRYDEAEILYQRSLKGRRERQGEQHPDTLTSMKNIAGVLFSKGHYEEAAQGFQTVMQVRQMILGATHPETLAVVNDLGEALEYAGNYADAEDKYRQALQGKQIVLGENHVSTLATRINLYRILHNDKDFDVLEKILKQALKEESDVLGEEHPDTMTTITDLAQVYECQGKWEQAEAEHRRALDLHERVLGPKHPFTLMCLNNFAGLKRTRANEPGAETMYRRALNGRRDALGDEHYDTLTSMDGLGEVLLSQGKFAAAESLFRSVLLTRQKTPGPAHPDTLASMANLAHALHAQRQFAEAESLYRHVLAAKADAHHGAEEQEERDADTVGCMRHLADLLRQQGQCPEAETLRRTLLEWCREDLGDECRETFWSMRDLALVLQDGWDYAEAESLFRRALGGVEELRGRGGDGDVDGIEDVWAFAEPLVSALRNRGLESEADAVLHRTLLAWCRAELGDECRETFWSMRDLAVVLQDGGEYAEAESLFRGALGGMERLGGLDENEDDVWAVAEPLMRALRARGLDADANTVLKRVGGKEQKKGNRLKEAVGSLWTGFRMQ